MLKPEENKEYFISHYFKEGKEVIIPQEIQEKLYDIIRDESADEFEPMRKSHINEEEIRATVSFIMSEIADLLIEENYLIREITP